MKLLFKIVSKSFNINHYIENLTYDDFKSNVDLILDKNNIPIADSSLIPTFSPVN